VGLALYNPLTDNWGEMILVSGHPVPTTSAQAIASWDRVSAHYLQNIGATVLRGRAFSDADTDAAAPVAVVTESFVQRFFRSDEDPLGQRFGLNTPENMNTFEIVGIVRDMKWSTMTLRGAVRPMFFVPLAQRVDYREEPMRRVERASHMIGGVMLVSSMPVGAIEAQLTRALAEVDPNLTIISVRALGDQLALAFDRERAVASLAGLFGIVSLVLAAVGLYGLTSYSVAQRTTEIGVRMALGADRSKVLGLVLRSALGRVVVGLALGIPLAIAAGKLIAGSLYGVAYWDPTALTTAAVALLLAAVVAALVPATRASAIPPVTALRAE
jgi:ABC-type antimicrobial peptide transport system permease subunit